MGGGGGVMVLKKERDQYGRKGCARVFVSKCVWPGRERERGVGGGAGGGGGGGGTHYRPCSLTLKRRSCTVLSGRVVQNNIIIHLLLAVKTAFNENFFKR